MASYCFDFNHGKIIPRSFLCGTVKPCRVVSGLALCKPTWPFLPLQGLSVFFLFGGAPQVPAGTGATCLFRVKVISPSFWNVFLFAEVMSWVLHVHSGVVFPTVVLFSSVLTPERFAESFFRAVVIYGT